MKLSNVKGIFKFIIGLILAVVISVWAIHYFSTKVFYLDNDKYHATSSGSDATKRYETLVGPPIEMKAYSGYKELRIYSDIYRIQELKSKDYEKTYEVVYPSGKKYTVKETGDLLLPYDENGELALGTQVYVNGERVLSPGEENYDAGSLVRAAFENYHERQGNVVVFIIAILFFVYSWFLFRKEAFQRFLFQMSYGLWVEDPEPTEFYFLATKAGAVIGMVMSAVFLYQSL